MNEFIHFFIIILFLRSFLSYRAVERVIQRQWAFRPFWIALLMPALEILLMDNCHCLFCILCGGRINCLLTYSLGVTVTRSFIIRPFLHTVIINSLLHSHRPLPETSKSVL